MMIMHSNYDFPRFCIKFKVRGPCVGRSAQRSAAGMVCERSRGMRYIGFRPVGMKPHQFHDNAYPWPTYRHHHISLLPSAA